ncbi:MAG: hypothetical protein ACOC8K_05980, partial [Gemmatimonadota bacterium]
SGLGARTGPGLGAEVAARALAEGVIVLAAGDASEVVELTPPVMLTEKQMEAAVAVLGDAVRAVVEGGVARR